MELFKIRCKQGKSIITEDYIRIELPGQLKQQTMLRTGLVGVDSKVTVFPFFGLTKGASTLVFRGQGLDNLRADLVATPIAREIVALLQKE